MVSDLGQQFDVRWYVVQQCVSLCVTMCADSTSVPLYLFKMCVGVWGRVVAMRFLVLMHLRGFEGQPMTARGYLGVLDMLPLWHQPGGYVPALFVVFRIRCCSL